MRFERGPVARWWRLQARERLAVLEIVVLLAVARCAASCVPLPVLLRWRPWLPGTRGVQPARAGALVEAVAARHPVRPRCLPRAIVGWWACRAAGAEARFVIGVARPSTGVMRAHATLIHAGRTIVGGTGEPFNVLLDLRTCS